VLIRLNDSPREVPPATTVDSLLHELGLDGRPGIAVALNDEVVPRSAWARRGLCENDSIVVLRAMQGG
jgi:sulfur carrier protein